MELKYVLSHYSRECHFPFNRTAYGIEMTSHRIRIRTTTTLLIAPLMELKSETLPVSAQLDNTFNRTAYGIEIESFPDGGK